MKTTRIEIARFMVFLADDGSEALGVSLADEGGTLGTPPNFVRWVGDIYEVELQNGIPTPIGSAKH